jgi:anthrone oxygenase-like protein
LTVLLEGIALLANGTFAGAAAYITFVEHPARLECGTLIAATEFGPSYRRATVMQASLAIVGSVASALLWFQQRDPVVLVAAILLVLVVPFTLLIIFPTNKRLLDPALEKSSVEAAALLGRWGRLHAVRTFLSGLSFVLLAWTASSH